MAASVTEKGNHGALLHAALDLRIDKLPFPEPAENEVLLAMGSVGICGSDIKYWAYGKCGRFMLNQPMVMGHEASGTILKLGNKVLHLKIGDRVAIEPGISCRTCNICKEGRYNLCSDIKFCATPPIDGNLAKFYVHAADFCYKLPNHVTLDEGALLEPLAVAVYGCERGGVSVGSNILICGAGPVGLLCLMVAKSLGAKSVCLTDIDDYRLQLAKDFGANHVIKVTTTDSKSMADIIEKTIEEKPDVTLECSGSDQSVRIGINVTKAGGSVVLIGRGSMDVKLPLVTAAVKEVDIKGVFRYANCYPKALALVASGAINVKRLITHHFSLEDTVKAFEAASSRDTRAVKVVIHCNN